MPYKIIIFFESQIIPLTEIVCLRIVYAEIWHNSTRRLVCRSIPYLGSTSRKFYGNARNFHSFTSDHTDILPLVVFLITFCFFNLRSMLYTLVSFCWSFSWSDKMSHKSLQISPFVNEPWSFNESSSRASHFLSSSPLCLVYSIFWSVTWAISLAMKICGRRPSISLRSRIVWTTAEV